MGKIYNHISEKITRFIESQKIFFVATAASDGRVNLSPKGMDTLHVVDKNSVIWLNATGSGNETAAHVQENPRMTLMFCSFDKKPMILRLYGNAKAVHPDDKEWTNFSTVFNPIPGARQIFNLHVDLVHTSCGFGVPLFDYSGERESLAEWAEKKGEDGIKNYWAEENSKSIDGKKIKI